MNHFKTGVCFLLLSAALCGNAAPKFHFRTTRIPADGFAEPGEKIVFTAELMKRLTFNCEIVSTKLSSYSGTTSTGNVRQVMGLTADITGRRVIIVEDIVDSGNTIVELRKILADKGASETYVCTMLLKPDACRKDITLDYVAIEIPNDFIVGFGLDYNEIGRNLKDIYVLDG